MFDIIVPEFPSCPSYYFMFIYTNHNTTFDKGLTLF